MAKNVIDYVYRIGYVTIVFRQRHYSFIPPPILAHTVYAYARACARLYSMQ